MAQIDADVQSSAATVHFHRLAPANQSLNSEHLFKLPSLPQFGYIGTVPRLWRLFNCRRRRRVPSGFIQDSRKYPDLDQLRKCSGRELKNGKVHFVPEGWPS